MKPYLLAPIIGGLLAGVGAATSDARAASPTESECDAAGGAAKQLRSAGNLFAARARLTTCLATSCSSHLREECVRQLAEIDEAMPTVLLEAKDETSNDLHAVRVTIDGAPILDRLDGTPILVNPGEHHLGFDAAGFRRAETVFVVHEREKNLRVVVFFAPAASAAPVPAMGSGSRAAGVTGHQEEPAGFAGHRKATGLVLGFAGVAGLAVGTAWSIMSKVTYDHALTSECGGDASHCSGQGIADGQTAHRQATIATAGFVAAGALFAAGAFLYFRTPKTSVALAPAIDKNGDLRVGGLTAVGNW